MKKLLALVLALVMTLSLATVSTNAAYADDADINYDEAVAVLSTIGVLEGTDGNKFAPKENLTRAQAAKIISYFLLGNKTAEGLVGAGKFTDVKATNWAAGFVDYCASEGIVNGVGDGKFDPNGGLTGFAFAKMLLVALGYDAEIEKMSGADWMINVSKLADQNDLFDGLDISGRNVITREQAAQMCLNTLKAPLVEYDDKGGNITINGATINVGASDWEYKTSTNKKAQTIDDSTINGTNAYTVEFAEEYYSDLKLNSDTSDDFGRPADEWTWKSETIGTYANTDDLQDTFHGEVTAADVYTTVGKTVSDDLKDGKATLTVYIDGVEKTVKKADVENYVAKNDTKTVEDTDNGDLTEIFVDDDNNTTIVIIHTYVFQASSDYSSKKDSVDLVTAGDTSITLDDKTLDGDDFAITDIKADDYILVNAVKLSNGRYDVKEIAVAELLSGEVTGYKVGSNVTIAGTKYEYSATAGEKTTGSEYTVGQDAKVVLDQYGYIIAVDKAIVSSNYVYVSEFAQPAGLSNAKVVAHAYFTDGTTDDVTIKEVSIGGKMVSNKADIMGEKTGNVYDENAGWYTYSKNSSNEYSLYAVESKYTVAGDAAFSGKDTDVMFNDKVKFLGNTQINSKSIYANNETIVVVDDGDDVTAYVGVKNIPDITLTGDKSEATVSVLAKNTGYAYYVFVSVDGKASISGSENSSLLYVIKVDGKYKGTDNDIYYTYKVLDSDGNESIVKADSLNMGGSLKSKFVYAAYTKVRTNSDDEITSADLVDVDNDKDIYGDISKGSISYSDGALNLDEGFTLDDDAKITLISTSGANALNKDKSADYEVTANMTGKELSDLVKGYELNYTYAGKVTDKDGEVIKELYVTITKATATDAGEEPETPVGDIAKVELAVSEESKGNITLFDANGKQVTEGKYSFKLYQFTKAQSDFVLVEESTYEYGVTPAFDVESGVSYYVVVDGVRSNTVRG